MDFSEVKSVFGFRVRLGNPDLDFENLNPDFPTHPKSNTHPKSTRIRAILVKFYIVTLPLKKNISRSPF